MGVPCWAPLCLFALPLHECEAPDSFGGVATMQCASVVGTTYSLASCRIQFQAPSLDYAGGPATLVRLAYSRPRLGGVD